jgi:adenylate cyclase
MSLFAELKRRNVVRVGIAYAVIAWVVAQIAEFAFENFGAPDWVLKTVVVLLLLGLPLVLVFAWAFELTPEGLKREKDVDRSQSITAQTGHKLDRTIIVVLLVALAWFAWDKFGAESKLEPVAESIPAVETQEIVRTEISEKSVAVLPFVAMSRGPDDEYFADGLTEEILNSLAQLPELLVTARTSAFSFKGQDIPIQEIAAALGVKHVVEGSVRRSGDRLRVTAQLIRANDGFHLWSENFDSSSKDTIAVQESIAEKIASAMDVVLDERKREAMKQAGLRDVEAFTLYQKGIELYERAHGEIDTIDGLRQANVYFEQVIERAPHFSQVYLDHSDLFVHILAGDSANNAKSVPESEVAGAYPAAIADYEAATRYAQTTESRSRTELDLAFVSGNWRGLGGRIERVLNDTGCDDSNWLSILADVFGYSERYLERAYRILACDPRRSLSWFNSARTALRFGDKVEALRLAREGSEIAPGAWLNLELIRALVANGLHEEARQEIDSRVREHWMAKSLEALVSAHEGDQVGFDNAYREYNEEVGDDLYWPLIVSAWGGHREEANRMAALIDQHHFGSVTLTQATQWCACGAPWDLEVTPMFAAQLKEGNLSWPPQPAMEYPLKDW